MAFSNDFYTFLSSLLRQTKMFPDAPPAFPFDRWPVESEEMHLLEDLQSALAAMQSRCSTTTSPPGTREPQYQSVFEFASDGLIIHDLETDLIVDANPAACTMYGFARQEFIGLHPTIFIHQDSLHQFTKYVQAIQSQGVYVAQQVHLRRDGSNFYAELSGALCVEQGRSVLLSIIRDVSHRIRSEQMLQQRVEARTHEQAALLEISQTLASAIELRPGLIIDQLRMIIDYSLGGLFKLEGLTLAALAVRGSQRLEQAMPIHIRLENAETLGTLFNGQRSTRIADVQSADPQAQLLRSILNDQAALLLEGVQSWMWVPLAIKGRLVGAIGMAHAERNYFTAHHADLALTVANQSAITMVNAELYKNAQALAALQEQQRQSQNLHDAVTQSLFSAGLIAEVLPRLWERDPNGGRQSLEDLRRLTRGAQAEMRLLLAELKPSTLIDGELGDLLRLMGNALAGRENIPIHVTVTGKEKLPADVQVVIYRLCQEGLNNIAKHAYAHKVDILLQYEKGGVELRIRDDGCGFVPDQVPTGHYGLSMMRERATAVGATLSFTSQPGLGTEIFIHWEETHY